MGLHQTKKTQNNTFCTAKETVNKMKKESTVWKNIFAVDTSDKGLSSKIYKDLYNLTPGKMLNCISKGVNNSI